LLDIEFISRLFFAIFIIVSFVFLLSGKIALLITAHYLCRIGHNFKRLLVVGTGSRAANFIRKIQSHPEWGLRDQG